VRVPRQIDLNLHSTNGGLYVDNITGKLRLETSNGKIRGREIDGLVKSRTTNGSISLEFMGIEAAGDLSFKTTNGSIKLYLPEYFGGDADLKTTNGHIESDFRMSAYRKKSKKRFDGTIGEGDNELRCNTTNGSIYLFLND
jgi:DUF4097 and DUF4098 domain-containing protein YvlB